MFLLSKGCLAPLVLLGVKVEFEGGLVTLRLLLLERAHLGLLLQVGLPVPLRARRQRGLPALRAREQLAPLRRGERARVVLLVEVVDELGQLIDVLGHALLEVGQLLAREGQARRERVVHLLARRRSLVELRQQSVHHHLLALVGLTEHLQQLRARTMRGQLDRLRRWRTFIFHDERRVRLSEALQQLVHPAVTKL